MERKSLASTFLFIPSTRSLLDVRRIITILVRTYSPRRPFPRPKPSDLRSGVARGRYLLNIPYLLRSWKLDDNRGLGEG